jgi:hypothetical protein
MGRDDLLDFSGEFMAASDSAILVDVEGEEVWLPKSVVGDFDDAEPGDTIDLKIPEWLAEDRGLI